MTTESPSPRDPESGTPPAAGVLPPAAVSRPPPRVARASVGNPAHGPDRGGGAGGGDSTQAGRLSLVPGLWLDARKAVWLEHERTLVVADTHLGYAWVQRQRGNLLPLAKPEEPERRLAALQEDYAPGTVVFLGDLVHAALELPAMENTLLATLKPLARRSRLVLTRGNHDRAIDRLTAAGAIPLQVVDAWSAEPHRLCHGDTCPGPEFNPPPGGWRLCGHSHPAVVLGDGGVHQVRCPAFLVGERSLVLPAFSSWAAGVAVNRADFEPPVWAPGPWESVVAILGDRLLRVPWSRLPR